MVKRDKTDPKRLVMLLYEVALKDGTVDTPLSESIIKLVISQ